ncbi:MAG: CRTAC1 family protein [Acidobacteriota bacterium]|nr:CRTAC1 family protein [Acidobacteriota bacterium]
MNAFRRLPSPVSAILFACAFWATACGEESTKTPSADDRQPPTESEAAESPLFENVARQAGLDFVHVNGMSGELYILEVMGSGAALFDYDGDGDLDLYLVQGHALPPLTREHPPLSDRLFRNDLRNGEPRFVDVTEEAGIEATGYGMGVASGDVDGDGHRDLFVTNYGANQLWRNRGDGTFVDITEAAGVGSTSQNGTSWSTATAFLDYDRDGHLDLFVGNFLDFTVETHRRCTAETSAPDYCSPTVYSPVPDRLFRGRGDGTFEDVTEAAGLGAAFGNCLGVVTGDLNGDGWQDLYVANDSTPNQMWINNGDGTFSDQALLSGNAYNREGKAEASMGVSAADPDGDGDLDLFMTHLNSETNTFYLNTGDGLFEDRSLEQGLAAPSLPYTSFGTLWMDYDNDSWLDLLVLNGEVKKIWSQDAAGDPLPLKQPDQLFRNVQGTYQDVSDLAGPALTEPSVSRAGVFGDIDNDGDLDVVVTLNNGPVKLLLNRATETEEARDNRWLGLRLVDAEGSVLGAQVSVQLPPARELAGRQLVRRVRVDGSYLAAHDPRVLVGLGEIEAETVTVTVRWPDGTREVWQDLPLEAYSTLRRGGGSLAAS